MDLFNRTADDISKLTTHRYSTSFTLGIKAFHKPVRRHIYAIYAFSRNADEIVDTLLDHSVAERRRMLDAYRQATWDAIDLKASPFPVLHAFQRTVNEFGIGRELVEAFFESMATDLGSSDHDSVSYDRYIYGSAKVIGLMCLKVFVKGDDAEYARLESSARSLGAAFQKVNFLRDMKSDYEERGRVYFPGVDFSRFDAPAKSLIEADIDADFRDALEGIVQLPDDVRKGVYLAYKYYLSLFNKIKKSRPETIRETRLRLPNSIKLVILAKTLVRGYVGAY